MYIIQFQSDCLRRHNELRKTHSCPPLSLSKSLCSKAQEWSEHLVNAQKYSHSAGRQQYDIGENLAFRWYTNGQKRPKGDEIADVWYNEIRDYSWEVPELNSQRFSAHFTQLIWKSTSLVGFGVAANGEGKVCIVAQYQSAGNTGDFLENVPMRVDGKTEFWPDDGAATTVPKGKRTLGRMESLYKTIENKEEIQSK